MIFHIKMSYFLPYDSELAVNITAVVGIIPVIAGVSVICPRVFAGVLVDGFGRILGRCGGILSSRYGRSYRLFVEVRALCGVAARNIQNALRRTGLVLVQILGDDGHRGHARGERDRELLHLLRRDHGHQ